MNKNKRLNWAIEGIIRNHTGLEVTWESIVDIMLIRLLANKHHRQCENACNGEGFIPRQGHFTCSHPDGITKSAYIDNTEETVFDREIARLEAIIEAQARIHGFNARFQHDPRGLTVKLFQGKERDISEVLYV